MLTPEMGAWEACVIVCAHDRYLRQKGGKSMGFVGRLQNDSSCLR